MASGHVQVSPDGSGKDIDTDALTSDETGSPTVYRQDVVIADPITYANKANVTNRTNALKVTSVDDIESRLGSAEIELLQNILFELVQIREAIEAMATFSGKTFLRQGHPATRQKIWDDIKVTKS